MTIEEIAQVRAVDCPAFSVFAKDKLPLPGVKKRLDEILNKEILVVDFRITKSKKREGSECLQIQFVCDDVICVAFTGSSVLATQIQSVREKIPFRTCVTKIDKYYSFS
ncbi:MAG: hypothetical protein IJU89_04445 [Alphaproteobacteria bacterium]|nr:hypothetical protein [Alphaproteobacteria bacterium]